MKFKIKRNDTVKVISGKEKGKTGKVRKVIRARRMVLVEAVNMVTSIPKLLKTGPVESSRRKLRCIFPMSHFGMQKKSEP